MENYNQANFDDDHNIKIKTPASLFSKSSSKSPINRLRIQPSPSQQSFLDNHCQNHQQKQAAYFTQSEGEKLYFCQKCAITLASHGHSITKIGLSGTNLFTSPTHSSSSNISNVSNSRKSVYSSSNRNNRQLQVNNFLQQLRDMRCTIGCTRQTIKQKLIESQQFYGEQLEQINDYFSLIIKSLELEKHKCYNHILTERKQAEQQIRKISMEVTDIDQGLTKILMDIQDNLETVYSIEEQMYKRVFSQYINQQHKFQSCLNGLLLQPIQMRKIEFEGVPESIYNISDVVIQNSIKNQENVQYRLADSLNAQDFSYIKLVSPEKPILHSKNNVSNSNNSNNSQLSNLSSLKFSFQAQRLRGQEDKDWKQDINFVY